MSDKFKFTPENRLKLAGVIAHKVLSDGHVGDGGIARAFGALMAIRALSNASGEQLSSDENYLPFIELLQNEDDDEK